MTMHCPCGGKMYVDPYGFYCNECEWTDEVQLLPEGEEDESAA